MRPPRRPVLPFPTVWGFAIALLLAVGTVGSAQQRSVTLDVYVRDGCPYCQKMEAFMDEAKRHGITELAVPAVFLGDRSWIGYNDSIASDIRSALQDAVRDASRSTPRDPGAVAPPVARSTLLDDAMAGRLSLFAATAVLGFLDGFCGSEWRSSS